MGNVTPGIRPGILVPGAAPCRSATPMGETAAKPERHRAGPDGTGHQYAALPMLRQAGALQVILVTSRETGRWVLPKGWAEPGLSGAELAAKEAYEEAGLRGAIGPQPLGSYGYMKRLPAEADLPCRVVVFGLEVNEMLEDWPERQQRQRRSFPPGEAAALVAEPELAALLRALAGTTG
jgi:8-oxo-dGTP pyrophosphatase MutT (NUDIX family)